MIVSQAFIFHFKCYSILHFAICQLVCWAFLFNGLQDGEKIANLSETVFVWFTKVAFTWTHTHTHEHTLLNAIGETATHFISLKNSPWHILTSFDIVTIYIVRLCHLLHAYKHYAFHVRTCQCIRFESLTLKLKVQDVDDLDGNWQVKVCKICASRSSNLFIIHYHIFRDRCIHVQMNKRTSKWTYDLIGLHHSYSIGMV